MHVYEYTNPLIIHNSKILKFMKTATNLVTKPKLTWPHLAAQPSLADISLCVCGGGGCVCVHASVGVQWLQSCSALCDPEDCSPSVSSIHGIIQARILVHCHFFLQGIFATQGLNHVSCIAHEFFTTEPPGKPHLFFNSLDLNINISIEISVCLIIGYYSGAAMYYKQHCKMCF